jgi:anaerobic selenocysteine-containing dehydrogenase
MGGGITGQPLVDTALRALGVRLTPGALADFVLRTGPYGDQFLPWRRGLTRERLHAQPHGVDLGPLKPGIRRRVRHRGGRLDLAPPLLMRSMEALAGELTAVDPHDLVLIGRRELRSNNSWMHNVPRLVAGKKRCVLHVHPNDAARCGLADGGQALMRSRVHEGPVEVKVTDQMRPGVVSLPHGYGHSAIARWQRVAGAQPGPSMNDWVDDGAVDSVAGLSILNGIPIELKRQD